MIGFAETLVEVNESVGEATLNVSISLNSSIQFEIVFSLFANTVNDSEGMVMLHTYHSHLFSKVVDLLYFSVSRIETSWS